MVAWSGFAVPMLKMATAVKRQARIAFVTISMRFLLTQNIAVGRIATHISRALIGSSQYGTFFSLVRVLYNPCGTSQWYIGMIRGNNGST
jgi:hypothetical protein